jgi:hypothetical protein
MLSKTVNPGGSEAEAIASASLCKLDGRFSSQFRVVIRCSRYVSWLNGVDIDRVVGSLSFKHE